jgi:hypothetical protein
MKNLSITIGVMSSIFILVAFCEKNGIRNFDIFLNSIRRFSRLSDLALLNHGLFFAIGVSL